ncbi:hypothetical protein ACWAUP_000350 [Pseudomonas aeruginosa]
MNDALKIALSNFRACAESAPSGTYLDAKQLARVIGEACDNLIKDVRAIGLKADNCDLIFAVEAAIYDYVKRSNPGAGLFPTAEGFGSSMGTEARDRVIANAERDRDSLAKLQRPVAVAND